MADAYPTPSYAATIWIAGNEICLGFSETRNSPGHTTRLPCTEKGLQVALQILRARQALPSGSSQVATLAEPTQFNLDRELMKYQKRVTLSADPDEALKELGLI